jgi:hypothetical protein
MTEKARHPIEGPMAWTGRELAAESDWMRPLSPDDRLVSLGGGDGAGRWRIGARSRGIEAAEMAERRIAPKALDKFKTQIREMTSRTRGLNLAQLIAELRPYLIGWRGYFGFCQTPRVLTNLEAWIRRRLRAYPWRQWRNRHNRFKELPRRGVPKFNAAVAAGSPTGFWRMSGHPAVQMALRNHTFDSLGLPRLHVSLEA